MRDIAQKSGIIAIAEKGGRRFMSKEWLMPAGLVYLPLHKEALPLLKKGVIPLRSGANIDLPWLLGTGANAPENQVLLVKATIRNTYSKNIDAYLPICKAY